jgi:hypothetical protein
MARWCKKSLPVDSHMDKLEAGNTFVQIGATRDGLDSYIKPARVRGMRTVLVETSDYLEWRRYLGRKPFDLEISVDHPANSDEVYAAIKRAGLLPTLVLPGFERYVDCAFAVAPRLEVGHARASRGAPTFKVPDKAEQRSLLLARCNTAWQPQFVNVPLSGAPPVAVANLGYPLVVKPTNGGGGLGVFVVNDEAGLQEALNRLRELRNYDGSEFATALVEQFMDGVEFSIQGLVYDGEALILSVCEKIIHQEFVPGSTRLRGFRETGHISTHGNHAQASIRELAQKAVTAVGYQNGPFHVDMIVQHEQTHFIEMGFRLSGGSLVSLVAHSTGLDWSEQVFRVLLGDGEVNISPQAGLETTYVGQVACLSETELDAGRTLVQEGLVTKVVPYQVYPSNSIAHLLSRHPTLASDILRHTGIIGRVLVFGNSSASVRTGLERCIANRHEVAACVD